MQPVQPAVWNTERAMRRAATIMTVAACLAVTTGTGTWRVAGAGDWPEFRGPTGQGLAGEDSASIPLTWSDTDNVRWKTPIDGLAWSSPVVVDGRVFLSTAVPGDRAPSQALMAVCLDADSGVTLWRTELFRQTGEVEIHGKNSHASPTPIVEEGRIYVHFGPHGTACLSVGGDVLWKMQDLPYGPRHGTGASPAIAGDVLVIPCDGWDVQYVAGVEKATGKIRWKVERNADASKGFSFATPLVIGVQGRQQAVCPGSGAVVAYDPATGDELWRVRYGDGYSVIPRPLYAHGLVYVCTGYGQPSLLAIDPTGSGDVTETHVRWETQRGVPHSASPLIVGEELYMVSDQGVASCLDARTGRRHWQERLGGNFSASPVGTAGRIYFQDENGTATVVQTGTEFVELGRSRWGDGGRTYASYAVSNGALFLRSETHVYRVEQDLRQAGG